MSKYNVYAMQFSTVVFGHAIAGSYITSKGSNWFYGIAINVVLFSSDAVKCHEHG